MAGDGGGYAVTKLKTAKDRLARAILGIREWCRKNLHLPVEEQRQALNRKLQGHYGYYGLTHNARSLRLLYEQVRRIWHQWLGRRSGRNDLNWDAYPRLLTGHPLASPRIIHNLYLPCERSV